MLLRCPQTCNCSTAAALKVSPAANMTLWPCALKRLASLPIVVVLPAPFTPITNMTKGLSCLGICNGLLQGARILSNSCFKANVNALLSASCLRSRLWVRRLMTFAVTSTPTSAMSKLASISSSRSSFISFRPNGKLARMLPSSVRVRDSWVLRRW